MRAIQSIRISAALAIVAIGLIAPSAQAAAPTLSIESASGITPTTAYVQGSVDREGQATTYSFQYATEADFSDANGGPEGTLEAGGPGPQRVNGGLKGLLADTDYHLRLVAENGDGSSEALASTFHTAASAPFGIQALDVNLTAGPRPEPLPHPEDVTDPANFAPTYTQAGGHPYEYTTQFRFNRNPHPVYGNLWPAEPVKNIVADLPPGMIGNPGVVEQCSMAQLTGASVVGAIAKGPLCPATSQVGFVSIIAPLCLPVCQSVNALGDVAIYSMEPPPGVPARFGFNAAAATVTLDATVRSGGDYGLAIGSFNTSEAAALIGVTVTFWGTPEASAHDAVRSCPDEYRPPEGESCPAPANAEPAALLRLPTRCDGALQTAVRADSWLHPGQFSSSSVDSHLPPGLPHPNPGGWRPESLLLPPAWWGASVGNTGCEDIPFEPSIAVRPTTPQADSPTGLEVDLEVPQEELVNPDAIAQSDLKDAVVRLPVGMSVNPASADGLGGCSLAQIDLHGDNTDPTCPQDSKIGTVKIDTPLLDEPLEGPVYLAKQGDNPFGSLIAIYLVAKGPGTVIKLAGEVKPSGPNGQLETVFTNQPQLPFSKLHLELKGGPRAALINPRACGTHTASATLTPWSGNAAANPTSSFELTEGPSGGPCPSGQFDPKLSAGSSHPIGGAYSPFALRLTRADGTKEITAISAALPQGLIGKLAGIPYCPEAALANVSGAQGSAAAQLASPSCPPASQVGKLTVGAGAGPTPFFLNTGKAYLAGPYKGAPLSFAFLTPALAGPFDLGSVLVRTALRVDPETAQITAVSDPLPTSLHGIGLDLRDIRVDVDRPAFTLNPTDCNPMAIEADITGTQGASAKRTEPFQVANCANLPFKPKLSLKLKGGTKRGDHPVFSATLKMPPGGANIAKAQVTLPHSEFLDQAHIGTVCTRVQFAAHACPARSAYGYAKATTPLLDKPLEGPVYLRSSSHKLPDLVADLGGQIEVALAGRIDTVNGGIRNTFEVVPDAPVSKFTLTMKGGRKGLLQNSTNLCAATHRATALFDGQNGKIADSRPALQVKCKGRGGKRGGH